MNHERYLAYLELVKQLLHSPMDAEEKILIAAKDLVDWGLVETIAQLLRDESPPRYNPEQLEALNNRLKHHPLLATVPSEAVIHLKTKQGADRLLQQGIECYQNSQFKAALQTWQQALGLYQEIGDFQGEANVLSNLGVALQSLGQYQAAIERYQQSLVVQRESGDWRMGVTGSRPTSQRWGTVQHHDQGEYRLAMKLAVDHFEKHLHLAESIGDRLGEAKSLTNLGRAYHALGQNREAIDCYQRSLQIRTSIQDHQGMNYTRFLLAQVYEATNAYELAIAHYQDYCRQYDAPRPDLDFHDALVGLANIYISRQDDEQAQRTYEQLLQISSELEFDQHRAIAWSGLGNCAFRRGNYQAALSAYQEALILKQQLGDRFGEAVALNNLSKVHNTLGHYDLAQTYQQRSLDLKRDLAQKNPAAHGQPGSS